MIKISDVATEIAETYPVFACLANKRPATDHGFKDATIAPDEITRQFSNGAELVGVPTGHASGLVVLDVDVKDPAKDGREWLKILTEEQAADLQGTRIHRTQSGGVHYVFKAPAGCEIACSASRIAPGIDVRGDGGYIIWAGSPGYQAVADADPAPAPGWLLDLCRTAPDRPTTGLNLGHGKDIQQLFSLVSQAAPGAWHDPMRDAVASMVGKGWPDDAIRVACAPYADGGVDDPDVIKLIVTAREKFDRPEGEDPSAPPGDLPAPEAFSKEMLIGILPRKWLMTPMTQRGQGTVIGGGGAMSKSTLALTTCLCHALGRSLLGMHVYERVRVWYIHAEDDAEEVSRRIAAICKHFNIDPADLEGWLFLRSVDDAPIHLVRLDGESAVRVEPIRDQMVAAITEHDFGLVVLDPLGDFYGGRENSNEDMRLAAGVITGIARETGAAIIVPHHTRKGPQIGDVDLVRGAKALTDKMRFNFMMVPMSEEEADAVGIDAAERGKFVSLVNVKANYVPPAETGQWFERVEVDLDNAAPPYSSDKVGVIRPYEPEGIFDHLSTVLIGEILDAIEAGTGGDLYSKRPQDSSRYAGTKIMAMTGKTKAHARKLLATWLESGLLFEDTFKDRHRNTRKGLRVDATKRPGRMN